MDKITYHWFKPGIDLGAARVFDGVDGPVIYEYACGTFGSPFHGPNQMHHLLPCEHQWDGIRQRMLKRDGVLNETNCPACRKVWDVLDARRGDGIDFNMRLKLYKEVIERKTLVDYRSAEGITEVSCVQQSGEEWPY